MLAAEATELMREQFQALFMWVRCSVHTPHPCLLATRTRGRALSSLLSYLSTLELQLGWVIMDCVFFLVVLGFG